MVGLDRNIFFILIVLCFPCLLIENQAFSQSTIPDSPPSDQGVAQNSNQLNFQSAPVSPILDLYGKLSGKHLIRDNSLANLPPVTIDASGLSKEDALKLISTTLLLNGVAIIPIDDQTMKIVTIGSNKNPRSEGVRLYTNEADLPNEDQIVSYYMSFDQIHAEEAAGIFAQVAPVHTYGGYVPAPSANGVVLTENVSVIRQLLALKKQIDMRRDIGGSPRGHPPSGKDLLLLLVLLIGAFAAGYFYSLRRSRKKLVSAT